MASWEVRLIVYVRANSSEDAVEKAVDAINWGDGYDAAEAKCYLDDKEGEK